MGKHHTREYKEYVSKLIIEEGRKISEVSYELEIPYSTVSKWVQEYRKKLKVGNSDEGYVTPKELEQLKKKHEKELQQLREENEILKKAMHIFTKNQE
ncbi:transposase [Metabacillus rhizolycopersici]|jgi:transposase|uniref:Transposase n=1 Tax=Metabacillus rhizolycopersici TaxID=2875709 RepID=A0ABS7V0L7_9BACI|nr:transposase [Metabacillus rhizolycopersici]MBZ5753926.1 transposase [Metabacillus rhizolycopersici]